VGLAVEFARDHFQTVSVSLTNDQLGFLSSRNPVVLINATMPRYRGIAFWIATAIFLGMLVMMGFGTTHNTLSAMLGIAVVFLISYIGRAARPDLFIMDFGDAIRFVDWNVVFLIMGMMIVIAIVERTGVFQWLALRSYQISGGRLAILLPILMLVTGVASAILDNVTTMLLMTPVTIQICLALGIHPFAFLMPEIFAANVIGISTLVGTPTNILIGSYAKISFNDFLINLTPGVVLAFIGLVLYCRHIYKTELSTSGEISKELLARLEDRARITEPEHLRKAGWVGLGMGLLFVFGEFVHLLPSVTALMGATAMLAWIKPDVEEMIEAVDWTTLVFFISLFMVIGAIQEVGLIAVIAEGIAWLVGDNLILAMIVVVWAGALLSTVIANIPFTAAMLPVMGYLTATIPGAESKALFYCLSVGSAMGGNGSLIGASANMVTAGIAERAGYPITYSYFLRKGFPALLITVALATIWLLIRFVVFG
jgi:Na+/H+ antiporter NhaD/arsenite permease-like protein